MEDDFDFEDELGAGGAAEEEDELGAGGAAEEEDELYYRELEVTIKKVFWWWYLCQQCFFMFVRIDLRGKKKLWKTIWTPRLLPRDQTLDQHPKEEGDEGPGGREPRKRRGL